MMVTGQEATIRRLWDCFSRSAFLETRPLFAETFVAEWPVSGERFVSPDAFIQVQIEYPGSGTITIVDLLETGNQVFTHSDVHWNNERATALSLFTFNQAGLITALTEWWPESYEPPVGREHLAQRV